MWLWQCASRGKGLCPRAEAQYEFEWGDRCEQLTVAHEDKLRSTGKQQLNTCLLKRFENLAL